MVDKKKIIFAQHQTYYIRIWIWSSGRLSSINGNLGFSGRSASSFVALKSFVAIWDEMSVGQSTSPLCRENISSNTEWSFNTSRWCGNVEDVSGNGGQSWESFPVCLPEMQWARANDFFFPLSSTTFSIGSSGSDKYNSSCSKIWGAEVARQRLLTRTASYYELLRFSSPLPWDSSMGGCVSFGGSSPT